MENQQNNFIIPNLRLNDSNSKTNSNNSKNSKSNEI